MKRTIPTLSVAMTVALVFSLLPGGAWLTLGGGVRWDWGCPVPFFEIQGSSPLHGRGHFLGWKGAWYLGFLADWLLWMLPLSCSVVVARVVSNWTRGRARWGFVFAVFISMLAMAYGLIYAHLMQWYLYGFFFSQP